MKLSLVGDSVDIITDSIASVMNVVIQYIMCHTLDHMLHILATLTL